jgi:hypothetical protein
MKYLMHRFIGFLLERFTEFHVNCWGGNGRIMGIGLVIDRDGRRDHFFEYLSPANKPVIPGLESFEVVYAKDQPEYIPLRTLRSRTDEGKVMSRWSPTAEQRKAVMQGADIYLTLLTFQGPLQPITLAVATDVNPDYIRHDFNLQSHEMLHSQLRKM